VVTGVEPDSTDHLAARRRKLTAVRARGGEPFANGFAPTHCSAEVQARFGAIPAPALDADEPPLRLAGRIVSRRDFGKASFIHLQDRGGRLQVYLRRDLLGDDAFALFQESDLGDIIGVAGRPFRTKTNELTLEAQSVVPLTKALRPLPEKWHGLTDVEARYRQRYLDLISNDAVRDAFRRRAAIIDYLRAFLTAREFLEVETPMMQAVAGGAAARPFLTHHHALDMQLALRIAPELYLKRLLVGGFERVFELNRVFRNEGVSTKHNPEFTMLEFYQAYATYADFMALTEEMLVGLADTLAGGRELQVGERRIDLRPPWPRVSIPEFVARRAELSLDAVLALDLPTLRRAADRLQVRPKHDYAKEFGDDAGGYFLTDIFESVAEAELVQPTFVIDFPVAVSPLARRSAARPAFVDRFELYIAGGEIANAFSELTDPDDQRARFESQLRRRTAGDEEAHPMDDDFVRALEHGMPPAAGEGIGVDRLVMLFTDQASIRDVILFPHMRPERR
jgi:lysyl-tRNA synthetase class 2